ncbi:unnamed protein product [Ambrosiozyma monospora]|uniref:Unnamed protein product n=1 Tax=Ambrosiozyma monospora TaxID=43982 RepID=A0ACB5U7H7_AMBMO|nr:unnamed protein product [Ambrosiozyma monospora]
MGLSKLVNQYKADLFTEIPKIKSLMFDSLSIFNEGDDAVFEDAPGQAAIDSLELIRTLFRDLDKSLRVEILDKLDILVTGLKSKYSVFRYSSAKCFATVASIVPTVGFQTLVKQILPMLGNALELKERQGAIECIYHLCNVMGADILPYVVFLIVPVLGRMSDSNNDVRVLSTTTFAQIIKETSFNK